MPTIQRLLGPAAQLLRTAGSPTPTLDVQLWLAHVCHLSRTQLLAHPEGTLTPEQIVRFKDGVTRLGAGEPLPYLTGQAEFYGLIFHVTPATLIPRPETEHLVEAALKLCGPGPDLRIADVGTGSGCIAVTLAVHRPDARLYAIDISSTALDIAARNANRHNVAERITLLGGHLLRPLPEKVHLIAANLPYVADHEWDELPAGVREHEPAAALRGGIEGLDLIEELLGNAPAALHANGAILLEIGASQGPAALALSQTHLPGAEVGLRQDYAGRDRLLVIQLE